MQAGYIVVFCGNLAISFLNHTGSHKAKKEKKKVRLESDFNSVVSEKRNKKQKDKEQRY